MIIIHKVPIKRTPWNSSYGPLRERRCLYGKTRSYGEIPRLRRADNRTLKRLPTALRVSNR